MEDHNGEPSLDLARFEQWATGDASRLRHITEVYRQTLTEALTRAQQALADSNQAALRRAAHDLKNCFQLVAAKNATSCAETIEQWAETSDLSAAGRLLARIEVCARQTLDAMEHLGKGSGPTAG